MIGTIHRLFLAAGLFWAGASATVAQSTMPQRLEPKLPKSYSIPSVDISRDTTRQVVVARGTETTYNGHVNTLLMPDGKTIWAVWTYGHGGPCGPMKKSTDGGLTWSGLLDVPDNWKTVVNCPTIHRLVAPNGRARLFVFAGTGQMYQAISQDEGRTWSPMKKNGLHAIVAPTTVEPVENGRKLLMWYERYTDDVNGRSPVLLWQSASRDGGLTWSETKPICSIKDAEPCEPACVRSPDKRQLLLLIREDRNRDSRRPNSLYCTSDDEGRTWSLAKELPAALTGDRHTPCYAPDGRLVVVMRDVAAESPTRGSFVAWVGHYDDIVQGREGQYRVKLLHQYELEKWPAPYAWLQGAPCKADCGYAGLNLLPDGTFVATTYVKYAPGPEMNSIVSVRFTLDEIDRQAARQNSQ
jgi:hypothetical protein